MDAGPFTVTGRQIELDGQPFAVRGVCYQPAAIGEDPSAAPPYGDYYTIGYQGRYLRDLENMRKMGANVARIYGWTIGADHSDFLANAWNGGEQSVYILVNRYINPFTDWSSTAAVNALVVEWQAIANELKNSPAVMGFLIGNEVNAQNGNGYNQAFWDAMNQIAGAVKAIAPHKLVSVAITDAQDQVANQDGNMTNFDFWGIQVYRGVSFYNFFDSYALNSGKPFIITEFGYDAYDAMLGAEYPYDAAYPAAVMEDLWNELRLNSAVSSGGCVFAYSDEWWKSGAPLSHDAGGFANGGFPDGYMNEEWWGIFRTVDNGSAIDILEPRAMFYRLAAMWNEPFVVSLEAGQAGRNLQVNFSYPLHLRDQYMVIEGSTDMVTWHEVGNNLNSQYLSPTVPSVSVSNTLTPAEVLVTLSVDPGVGLANGDFEAGDAAGWTGPGVASTDQSFEGIYSLKLSSATGGFSVPTAYQSFPAAPGDEFNLSGYLFSDTTIPAPPNATFGLMKIVFRDIVGNDLEPAFVRIGQYGPGSNPGGESLPVYDSAFSNEWIFTEVQATAPADTVEVLFFAILVDESPADFYFDAIRAFRVPGANLLVNGDFESGDAAGWNGPGVGSANEAKEGTYSLRLSGAGGFSVPSVFQASPAAPGDEFNLSGFMLTPSALPANATFGLFKIVFQDASGSPLEPGAIAIGVRNANGNPGAESQPFLDSGSSAGQWHYSEVQAVAPAGTAQVLFFVINVDESPDTLYFDAIEALDMNAFDPAGPRVFFRISNNGR